MLKVAEIVDPHVHHWSPATNPWYPGLSRAGMDAIAHDYLASEYRADAAGYDVAAIVHVSATTEPRAYLDEQRWLAELYTTYQAAAGELQDHEQRALFADTARHVYGV
jgi:predicted TIM-barrel fold metal-dependent hydrolase